MGEPEGVRNPHDWTCTPVDPAKTLADVVQEISGESNWPNPADADIGIVFAADDEEGYAVLPRRSILIPAGAVIREVTFDLSSGKGRMTVFLAERHVAKRRDEMSLPRDRWRLRCRCRIWRWQPHATHRKGFWMVRGEP